MVAAAAAVLVLAGCAPKPAAPPISTFSSSVAPRSEPIQAATPSFLLGIGCADILTVADVQAQVAAPVSVKADEHTPPADAYDVALDQVGGLRCVWGGSNRTDGGYDDGLNVALLPRAADGYATWMADAVAGSQGCQVESLRCSRDFLVADVWVEADYADSDRQAATQASIEAAFGTLVDHVRSKLAGVTTRHPLWIPPADVLRPLASCADSVTKAAGILGVAAGDVSTQDDPPYRNLPEIAAERAKMTSCSWSAGDSQLDWTVVPGGAWSLQEMSSDPPQPTLIERLRPAAVPGARAAFIGCGEACVAYLNAQESFVLVGMESGLDDAKLVTTAADALAAFGA